MQGKVKWFDDTKGYGFINDMSNTIKDDIFVHYSEIHMKGHKTLTENDEVTFELYETAKGMQAKNVIKLNAETSATIQ